MKLYGLVGAGGFGREVMPLINNMIRDQADCECVFLVEEKNTHDEINQKKVLTIDEFFAHPAAEKYFNIAIADHTARKRIAELMISIGAKPYQINANNYIELDNNQIAEGAIFCPFTTVTSNAKIGKFFQANIYSYIAHDCVIGDYVTFAPNVHCNGGVIIEDQVYAGTGVIIRQGTKDKPIIIGQGAILGMGAVITKSVPAFTTVIGNPATPLLREKIKG